MSTGSDPSSAMWGGRFAEEADALFRAVNDSLPVDWRLVEQDIRGSIAWTHALHEGGVVSVDERASLEAGLLAVLEEARSLPGPPVESGAEDVHTWVEQRLTARAGDLGKKLHTGRSRNDQVATDLRLWTRDAIADRRAEIARVRGALVAFASDHADTAVAAYTHLQRAQPIVLGHWAMAYAEMLARDDARLADALVRVNECPLGAAALAGTTLAIDRSALAERLGFDAPSNNSIDATCDRDFVIETIGALALVSVHLSRLAEDLIVYASSEFGFVEPADAVSSGSSLMPQKKNPDALELIRGKAGVIGAQHAAMLTVVKGLPTAYNKDLQEDKRCLFTAMDESSLVLRLSALVVSGLKVDAERCRVAAMGGYSNATELADAMVAVGVPFREAHERSGRLVRVAMERGVPLEGLGIEDFRAEVPALGESVFESLTVESALARRDVWGGTAPARVREQIARCAGTKRARSEGGVP